MELWSVIESWEEKLLRKYSRKQCAIFGCVFLLLAVQPLLFHRPLDWLAWISIFVFGGYEGRLLLGWCAERYRARRKKEGVE